jgi:hypothetical protein
MKEFSVRRGIVRIVAALVVAVALNGVAMEAYDFEKAWGSVQKQADEIDELINDFNDRTGLLKNL